MAALAPSMAEWVPPASPVPLRQVEVQLTHPTRAEFKKIYKHRKTPLLLKGYAAGWPCCKWTLDSLVAAIGPNTEVLVSISNEEVEKTVKTASTFKAYVDALRVPRSLPGPAADRSPAAVVPYLKQFNLLEYNPQLQSDIVLSMFPWLTFFTVHAWLGAAGAVTGMHNDDESNIVVQIIGKKRFLLVPPQDRPYVYVNEKYDEGTLCCDVQADNPDLIKHPLFAKATVYEVILEPGDVLFVPIFWFHHVRSLTTTVSINCFASNWWEIVTLGCWRMFTRLLHKLGFIGRTWCVCHESGRKPQPAVNDS